MKNHLKTKEKFPVHFTLSQKTLELEEGVYLLEEAERNGIEMEADCREGVCGACATKANGRVEFATDQHCLSREQIEAGWILTCISKVKGPITLEE